MEFEERMNKMFGEPSGFIREGRVKDTIYNLAIHFGDRDLHEESIWLLEELGFKN